MASRIQLRHDTVANWSANDPILAVGEPGVETDTGRLKVGDGARHWSVLPYAALDVNTYVTVEQIVISPVAPSNPALGMIWIQTA